MFSIHQRSDIEQDIQRDVDLIVSAIDATLTDYEAIYLVGSFGRGEGTVEFDGSRWRGVNDYDVLVVCDDNLHISISLKNLGRDLARRLAIDFVDVGCIRRSLLKAMPPTIENYDLKYASMILAGDDVRGEIPPFRRDEIDAYEFVRLLSNRAAGLLTTWLPERARRSMYSRNQYIKACIAAGDVAVYLAQGYEPSYAARLRVFCDLVKNCRLPFYLSTEAIACIVKAYEAKLSLCSYAGFSIEHGLMQAIVQNAFCAVAARCTAKPIANIFAAEKALHHHYKTARFAGRAVQKVFGNGRNDMDRFEALKHRILFSQPVFFCHYQSGFKMRLGYLSRFATIPGALAREWSALSAVLMWEEYCH